MLQLITTAFATANIFLTIFLMLVLLYWITVILGALDMNAIDIDMDTDIDIDADVDIDAHVDAHVDGHIHTHVDVHHGGGFMLGMLRFFNFGQVPFMVIFSILILCMWSISVYVNSPNSPEIFNPQMTAGWAMILLMPNFLISLFLTKFITYPLVPLFKALDSSKEALVICGQIATLSTSASASSVGQAKLTINGSVVSLSVRTLDGEPLEKGTTVLVIEENKEERIFIVQKMDKF